MLAEYAAIANLIHTLAVSALQQIDVGGANFQQWERILLSKSHGDHFKSWWKFYFYKGLYPEMQLDELKEISGYEPAEAPLVEMARNRAYSAIKRNGANDE